MKFLWITLICAAAVGIGYSFYLSKIPPERAMIEACEKDLKVRLKAPATYSRERTVLEIERVTIEKALEEQFPSKAENDPYRDVRETFRALYKSSPPYRHTLYIIYDAANAYGTPIRGAAKCEVFRSNSEPLSEEDLHFATLRIDGQTNTEWLVESLGGSQ